MASPVLALPVSMVTAMRDSAGLAGSKRMSACQV